MKHRFGIIVSAAFATLVALLVVTVYSGCSFAPTTQNLTNSSTSFTIPESPFSQKETVDLSGYPSMADSSEPSHLAKTTVLEVAELMEQKSSFVLYTGYEKCPHCNRFLPLLNEVAAKFDTTVGYIDTRADPSWQSNLDIDDYDVFVKYFDEWLDDDEEGKRHLYVPETFFVKDGKVVEVHKGVSSGSANSDGDLTAEERAAAIDELISAFSKLQ